MTAIVEIPVKPEARPYLDAFADNAQEPQWLRDARRQGLDRFAELGFPSRRSESWRYLDLQPLAKHPMLPAARGMLGDVPPELGLGETWTGVNLVNGVCEGIISRPLPEGVWIAPTSRALRERPNLIRAAVANGGDAHPFASLNAALFADGYAIDIGPGAALDRAIQVVHFASKPGALHTRSIIRLAPGCRATVIETFAGRGAYWRNDVLTISLGDGAALTRITLVEEGVDAVHLGEVTATLDRAACFTGFALILGGQRVRQETSVTLAGENARCRLDGAFVVSGSDEANIVTSVDHAAPGGQTRELIKGVAAGRGHGAFQGRITVREDAQKTDAHQLSRNLLIGQHAAIDTKPELEILADDVKCAHGASVGDLDEAALFYLQARGIPAEEARHMLIDGFLREVVETVDDFATRTYLLRRLAGRLGSLEE